MNQLEEDQITGINSIKTELKVVDSVCAVSPTGSGKSVIIANISEDFLIENSKKNVVIFVHRDELLNGIRETILEWFGHIAQKVDRHTKMIDPNCRIFVIMVETFDRRSIGDAFLNNFKNVGLCIVDECHLDSFTKIFIHFFLAKRIGFTATPKTSKKNKPLNTLYRSCVIISTIPKQIELNKKKRNRGCVPALEFSLGKINRKDLKTKGDDFDDNAMGEEFGKQPQIENTLNAYLTLAYGKKTLIFNANIDHSIKMHNKLLEHGLNSRHLDSDKKGDYASDSYRKDTWEWFKNTPNAILNNVGIATIGNDVKSIECVIINKCTLSMTLFKQMIGRGARAFMYPDGTFKPYFILLDMGNNILGNTGWRYADDVDWKFIFDNPKVSKLDGIATTKICPECGAINYASARYCQGKVISPTFDINKKESFFNKRLTDCGFIFPVDIKQEDTVLREMIQIGNGIDVGKNIEFFKDKAEYYSYFQLFIQIANMAKSKLENKYLDSEQLIYLYEISYTKATEWHKLMGKKRYSTFKDDIKNKLISNLKNLGFVIPVEEIEELNQTI